MGPSCRARPAVTSPNDAAEAGWERSRWSRWSVAQVTIPPGHAVASSKRASIAADAAISCSRPSGWATLRDCAGPPRLQSCVRGERCCNHAGPPGWSRASSGERCAECRRALPSAVRRLEKAAATIAWVAWLELCVGREALCRRCRRALAAVVRPAGQHWATMPARPGYSCASARDRCGDCAGATWLQLSVRLGTLRDCAGAPS